MRDAFCQTSDIESKLYDAYGSNHSQESRSTLQPSSKHSKERNINKVYTVATPIDWNMIFKRFILQASPSSSNLATPPVFSPPSSSGTKPLARKPSRTVHIDVYCTGSDLEDSSSSSSSSDSIDEPNIVELESNSTPQTVYDSNQLKLHHTRVAGSEDLPRRMIASNQHDYLQNASYANLRDYILAQCDSKDEVIESKQMLFEKHVGGMNDGRNLAKPSRFTNSRNRFHLHREQSDDCISSNYPNSTHSTVRDLTCSSISSVMAASSPAIPDDIESSWKETDIDNSTKGSSVCPSDSFEYENRCDRWRIRQMDEVWKDRRWKTLNSSIMHDSIEETVDDVLPNAIMQSELNDVFETCIRPRPVYGRGKSMELCVNPHATEKLARPVEFWSKCDLDGVKKRKSPTMIPGYTREHLLRAQKFGSVIEAIRKPGHHVGPAKNPDCQCEYCRRWFSQRGDHFRERASSLDITFISAPPSCPTRRYF